MDFFVERCLHTHTVCILVQIDGIVYIMDGIKKKFCNTELLFFFEFNWL